MKSIIEVKNLSFRYKEDQEHYDVNNVSFHLKRGEWLSIVGHNGSGKSTTIRLIDGLLEAESGEIWIDGQLLSSENVWDLRRQIGMVFQNPDNQFVGATVEDDVAFGLENQGLPREEMKKRVADSLELEEVAMSDRVLVMKKGQVESTSSPRELFSRDDLDQIGLDEPFTNQLRESLRETGYRLPDGYLTEGELEDKLWELL